MQTSIQSEPVPMPETTPQPASDPVSNPGFGGVVRGVVGYAVVVTMMFLVPPTLVFLPAILFHCGIRRGRRAAWAALVVAVPLISLSSIALAHSAKAPAADINAEYAVTAGFLLAVAVPALVALPLVIRGERFGRVLLTAIGSSMVGLGVIELAMRATLGFSPYADQLVRAAALSRQFMQAYKAAGIPAEAIAALSKWMEIGVYCLPAFLLINVIVVFVLSLLLLGRIRAWRQFLQTRAIAANPYYLRNLSLPDWLLFAFVAGGLTPLLHGMAQQVTANMLTVVIFLYLLQGLAIYRFFLVAAASSPISVLFGYIALVVLLALGVGPIMLAVAGLFDSFFDFRHLNRKDDSHESHID